MKKVINPARVAEGLVAAALALCLLWLALSRVYLNYVTPRTVAYLYFAAAALLAIGGYNFAHLFEVAHVRRYTQLLALLIPLVLLTASVTAKGLWSTPLFGSTQDAFSGPALQSETYLMLTPAYAGRELHGYDATDRSITVPEAETYFWLTEIYNDPTPFLGFTVHTMGQVLKDSKYFTADCFSPSRKLMSCCVADLFTIGFKCQYSQTQALSEGTWISVTGTLAMVDTDGSSELRLVVDTAEACAAPLEPYVYAY